VARALPKPVKQGLRKALGRAPRQPE
jgi:hypothetical protein